jgi:putative oxidoreductase
MDFNLTAALVTVGQLFIGALYVYGGLNHFGPASEKIVPMLAARGVPMPRQSLYAASAFQAACGACLMLGIAVVPAAIGLVVFTVAASLVMVNFWDLPSGRASSPQTWPSSAASSSSSARPSELNGISRSRSCAQSA